MIPPTGSADRVLKAHDAVDIPVLFRAGPDRRPDLEKIPAPQPWPGLGIPPSLGWYLATTTWREVLASAISVGRDVTPWLARVPHLAGQELLARVSPLTAHLIMDRSKYTGYGCGRRLIANAVYTHGAERSSRGAFAYRLGMVMAEWVTRRLLGLGPTSHTESSPPPGAVNWNGPGKRPDLHGTHSLEPALWLVEAKAARRIGLPRLREGARQLREGGRLVPGPHRQVLCGASIENQVFVTADDLTHRWTCPQPEPPGPKFTRKVAEELLDESDEALAAVAREQMLIFWHLRYASAQVRRDIVPVARVRGTRPAEATGILVPIEGDGATAEVRQTLRLRTSVTASAVRSSEIDDFLTAPVPNTSMRVGMSRRLYGACERLDQSDRAVVARIVREEPDRDVGWVARISGDEDREIEELRARHVARFRELDRERAGELRRELREAFNSAAERSWDRLTGDEEIPVSTGEDRRIEAAAPDIYLAIDPADPVVSSMPS